jgi:formate dehydrogenase subunit gamma
MSMSTNPVEVPRHGVFTRIVHWIVALSFILLGLSGLAMFYHGFFFLAGLFGDGETMRLLHPWIGVVLVVSYFLLFCQFVAACLPESGDGAWLAKVGDVIAGREENLPEAGKFNAGQKLYFWAMALLILVMAISGVLIWNVYFGDATGLSTQRLALLVHGCGAALVILAFIVHIHMVTMEPGTLRAMIHGTVTGGWAWKHHRKWLRQVAASIRGRSGAAAPPAE